MRRFRAKWESSRAQDEKGTRKINRLRGFDPPAAVLSGWIAGELDQVDSIERHKTEVLAYLPNAEFNIIKGSGHLISID
jgi:hypothetical protein